MASLPKKQPDVMVQIRHVPDAVHRKLKARAALAGMSLSDYLLAEAKRLAEQPTWEEIRARIRALPPVKLKKLDVAQLIREERERR
jgi:hypothetical protein